MSNYELDRLAERMNASETRVDGLVRAQQTARTVIAGVTIAESLEAAAATGEQVDGIAIDVADLNESDALSLDGALTPAIPFEDPTVVDAILMADDIRAITEGAQFRIDEAKAELETNAVELDEALREAREEREQALEDLGREKSRVDEAFGTAGDAFTMAGTKSRITYSTDDPEGEGSEHEVWRTVDGSGNVLREWRYMGDSVWQEALITTEAITNLDVGKLTVGSAVMSDVVAQEIAARSGKFIELDVDQLTVTGDSVMNDLVLEKIFAEAVVAKTLTATEKFITKDVLATGSVTSEKVEAGISITAPTIIGGEFYGNRFQGGQFKLETVTSSALELYDDCEAVGPWRGTATEAALARSTVQKKAGTYSIVSNTNGPSRRFWRPLPAVTYPRGGQITFWIYLVNAGSVHVSAGGRDSIFPVAAGVWTLITHEIPPLATAPEVAVSAWVTGTAYLDELRLVTYSSLAGGAALERDNDGRAVARSFSPSGVESKLVDGRLHVGKGSQGTETKYEELFGTGLATTKTTFGDGSTSTLEEWAGSSVWTVRNAAGEEAWVDIGVSGGDGPWIRINSDTTVYGELSAESIYLDGDTNGWINLPYSSGFQAGTAQQAQIQIKGGVVYYRGGAQMISGSYSMAEVTIVPVGGVPAAARPTQATRFAGQATGGRMAAMFIHPDGRVIVRPNADGTAPTWISGVVSYPKE